MSTGFASARYIASLLYEVKATDVGMLALPALATLLAALPTALPAVIRAVRTDPARRIRKAALFLSQHLHRVDSRGAGGGNQGRERGHNQKNAHHA